MDAPADRDTVLLQHLAQGDVRAAGTRLVHGYADEVYALCRSMLRDATLAEDVSQEVFVRAFKALPEFRGEASVRTWILRIARNRCIDELRARRREPWDEPQEPDLQPAPEPSIADLLERRQDVRAGLDALGESERALVVLRFGHGLGYPELADAFDLAEGAVRMRLSRAVAKMRAAIAPTLAAPMAEGFGAPPVPRSGAAPRKRAGWLPWQREAPPAPAAPPAPPAPSAPSPPKRSIAPAPGAPPPAMRAASVTPSPFAEPAPTGLRARLASLASALA